jgi:predicted O-methyltransferase YrrM
MKDTTIPHIPTELESIEQATLELGFSMASDRQTGALLRTLVASKPDGRVLELGTGTGLSTSWLLSGMSEEAVLESVDNDGEAVSIAERFLGHDYRVTFSVKDGLTFLKSLQGKSKFDVIFADSWPGKYNDLELALNVLNRGGFYVIDDMLPQPNWPEDHPPKVAALLNTIDALEGYHLTRLCWSTGIILVVKE